MKRKIQYRRVDKYLSELKEKYRRIQAIDRKMIRFPSIGRCNFILKRLIKAVFAVRRLEEWNSHKQSEWGTARRSGGYCAQKKFRCF